MHDLAFVFAGFAVGLIVGIVVAVIVSAAALAGLFRLRAKERQAEKEGSALV